MNESALIIRADASVQAGIGHILRSLAIAQDWRDRIGPVSFACAEIPQSISERLMNEGMSSVEMSSVAGSLDDAAELVSSARRAGAVAIVLDGYQFDYRYHAAISRFDGVTLAIDDNAHLPAYATDYVLNQNLGATPSRYAKKSVSGKLLLGTRYALIRREFMQSANNIGTQRSRVERVLVTLGGSDAGNATGTVIDGLCRVNNADLQFRIIVGELNEHCDPLRQQIGTDPRFELIQGVHDMASQYRWADFAVVAGGSTNWELCYFGIPRMVLVIADNQRDIAERLHRLGVAVSLGDASIATAEQIATKFEEFIDDTAKLRTARKNAFQLVDGLGARRCVDSLSEAAVTQREIGRTYISQRNASKPLVVREARIEDWSLLLEWRNDPATRSASRCWSPIDEESHRLWLRTSLEDEKRSIYIAEVDSIPVGTARIDLGPTSELSWTVAPEARGKGIGRQLVSEIVRMFPKETLRAVAKTGNLASRRVAEAAGLNLVATDGVWMTFERKPSLPRNTNE